MRRRSEKRLFSVTWNGITFVNFSSRKRTALEIVETDRIYALCPGNKIAVSRSDSLFKAMTSETGCISSGLPGALYLLGVIDTDVLHSMQVEIKKREQRNQRSREIRDLKNAIEETGLFTQEEQEKAIKEFYPDWNK